MCTEKILDPETSKLFAISDPGLRNLGLFLHVSCSKFISNFIIFRKLQSDLKTTKVEEMKVQLETCYKEILRLSTAKQAGAITA